MKILFLDIDGVLNDFDDSHLTREERKILLNKELSSVERQQVHLDSKLILRLNHIVQETQCKIVLSSAWRNWFNLDDIHEMFSNRGFLLERSIWIGKTDHFLGADRGIEILKFLVDRFENNEEMPESFCIVDDMSDMEPFVEQIQNRFVQTDDRFGLSDDDAEKIISLLNNQNSIEWENLLYSQSGMMAMHVGKGWRNIVKNVFFEMKKIDRSASFGQVKEKFGLLRIYSNSNRASVHELCWKAESESEKYCEDCGAEDPILSENGHWIRNLCQSCRNVVKRRKDARAAHEKKFALQKNDLLRKLKENLIDQEEYLLKIQEIENLFDETQLG